jgi:predicted ArsR family transcriptional regulator
MQATIIGHLRKHPGQTRAEIADALEIPKMTVANGLEKLLEAGLIIADPPRDVAIRGQRVRYIVDDAQVTEMVMRLNQVLGEF